MLPVDFRQIRLAFLGGGVSEHMTLLVSDKSQTRKPKLFVEVRRILRSKHDRLRTPEGYVASTRRFIVFNGKRHPRAMGAPEMRPSQTHPATDRHVPASTQNQALSTIPPRAEVSTSARTCGRSCTSRRPVPAAPINLQPADTKTDRQTPPTSLGPSQPRPHREPQIGISRHDSRQKPHPWKE